MNESDIKSTARKCDTHYPDISEQIEMIICQEEDVELQTIKLKSLFMYFLE